MNERSPWSDSEAVLRVERAMEELGSAMAGAEWHGWQLNFKFAGNTFQCTGIPPLDFFRQGVALFRWPVDDLRGYEQWKEPEL